MCFGAAVRYLVNHNFKTPSSIDVYLKWIKSVNLIPVVDELRDGAYLLWIGPKRLDKVLFYCHGVYLVHSLRKSFVDIGF